MEEKIKAGFGLMTGTAVCFTVEIIATAITGSLGGNNLKEISSLFLLGSEGIAYITLLQYLVTAFLTSGVQCLCFSEKLFGNMMVLWRSVIMLIGILAIIIVSIIAYGWFPVTSVSGWFSFVLSFTGCFGVSLGIMVLKTKLASRKYEKMLENYQSKDM